MSGYTGNPDAEAEHALIISENGVEASRRLLVGSVLAYCVDCGEEIAAARRENAIKQRMKCIRCIDCQSTADSKKQNIKMLDRIL